MAGIKSTTHRPPWSLADTYDFISTFLSTSRARQCRKSYPKPEPLTRTHSPRIESHGTKNIRRNTSTLSPYTISSQICRHGTPKRHFHDYFVTHLPSSSLHPDSRSSSGPHHKLPRSASTPHTPGTGPSPAAAPPMIGASRELTVVRIPLRSAKHHFGVSVSRGTRPYNEDTFQAGTLEIPAFAKRAPISLSRFGGKKDTGGTSAESASGDPQVFYFGVFDGHGGNECSDFLREELHAYLERTAGEFELGSSLKGKEKKGGVEEGRGKRKEGGKSSKSEDAKAPGKEGNKRGMKEEVRIQSIEEIEASLNVPEKGENGRIENPSPNLPLDGEEPVAGKANKPKALELERSLVSEWKNTVGGYFRRFKPDYFSLTSSMDETPKIKKPVSIESVLMYSFLKADLDFIIAQARKPDLDDHHSDKPLNADDILGEPAHLSSSGRIGGPTRFVGGSTASIALISTPSPTPFWHPSSPSTLIVAHVGDTRIILCETSTGLAKPVTTNHHPNSPIEGTRLRRYAATFVTDSFGEERMSGLANTRAFGDMQSKRIGVSAEPEIRRLELGPAEYSFLVLVSDG
ncbi:hypothetical protein B7494_g8584, partial [Chlorociboria aeruginascens]